MHAALAAADTSVKLSDHECCSQRPCSCLNVICCVIMAVKAACSTIRRLLCTDVQVEMHGKVTE